MVERTTKMAFFIFSMRPNRGDTLAENILVFFY